MSKDELFKETIDSITKNSAKKIDLGNCNLSNIEIIELIGALIKFNNPLEYIDLSNCNVEIDGIKLLAQFLESNNTVKEFYFSDNNIGNLGAEILAAAFKNNTIKHIDLCDNDIGIKGVKALAQFLESNDSLETFHFSDNNIGYLETKILVNAAIKNNAIKYIDLCNYKTEDKEFEVLIKLEGNASREILYNGNHLISSIVLQSLNEAQNSEENPYFEQQLENKKIAQDSIEGQSLDKFWKKVNENPNSEMARYFTENLEDTKILPDLKQHQDFEELLKNIQNIPDLETAKYFKDLLEKLKTIQDLTDFTNQYFNYLVGDLNPNIDDSVDMSSTLK